MTQRGTLGVKPASARRRCNDGAREEASLRTKRLKWLLTAVGTLAAVQVLLDQLWHLIDDNDPPPGAEQQLAVAAALMILALPHVIAAIAARGRRSLLAVAGAIAIMFTPASIISPVLVVIVVPLLLVPGIIYLMRARPAGDQQRLPIAALILCCLLLAGGAVGALFVTRDPRCTIFVRRDGRKVYEAKNPCDPYNSGRLGREVIGWSASSDTIAWHESSLSLLLSGAAIAACLWGTTPPRPGRRTDEPPHLL